MLGKLGFSRLAALVGRHWKLCAGLCLAAAGLYIATDVSDRQGRADLSYGYGVRMTCEADPESHLWSGGCERIAADLARTDVPSFAGLVRAFLVVHHTPIPSAATRFRFAHAPCDGGFKAEEALRGTRFILSVEAFSGVCSRAHAQAVMDEIDARDRALLAIERAGLSWSALAAGAVANLLSPPALAAALVLLLALWAF